VTDRWVVLGLAPPRTAWFSDVTRWATSGMAPVDFAKCISASEVRARLATGRPHSALLIDGAAVGADRDLIAAARDVGAATLVVDDPRVDRNWLELGAAAVLPDTFGCDDLTDALAVAAAPIKDSHKIEAAPLGAEPRWTGRLIAVIGRGGVGTSTVAMAAAQALAEAEGLDGTVALADLSSGASQAMYHDTGDVVPGVVELSEAHRHGRLTRDRVREQLFELPNRQYHLLAGLRRRRDWTALRPHAFSAALEGLRATYATVVADLDSNLDGEAETASPDTEEQHLAARTVLAQADHVLAVGSAGLWGVAHLAGLLDDLGRFGIDSATISTVINRAPRSPARRAEMLRALSLDGSLGVRLGRVAHQVTADDANRRMSGVSTNAFLPERHSVEAAQRAATPLPKSMVRPVAALLHAAEGNRRGSPATQAAAGPEPIDLHDGAVSEERP
jgi:MinD-like ATPase involved in chromosome partitioning or flagellar assembly